MVKELGGVCGGAVDAAEHVLGVARVALAPGFVVEGVDEAGAVVTLVEGDGDEAGWVFHGGVVLDAGVPGGYYGGGDGGHLFGGLEAWVEEPEAGDGGRRGGEFGEAMDVGEDAGDGVGLGRDGGIGVSDTLEGVVGCCHCGIVGGCWMLEAVEMSRRLVEMNNRRLVEIDDRRLVEMNDGGVESIWAEVRKDD